MSSVASQILGSAEGNSGAPLRASTEPQSQQQQQKQQQQKSEPNTLVFHQQQQSQSQPPPQQQQEQHLFPKPQATARPLDTGSGKSSLLSTAALHPSRSLSTTNTGAAAPAPAATIPLHQHSSSNNHSNSNSNNNFHPRFTRGLGVPEPRPTDVICGRGKMTASHPANRRFRELVDSHKASYQNSKRRDEKTRITCELVDQLRGEGRFVLFDPGTKLWYEVSEEYAREKVSHSLRSRSSSDHQRCASHTANSISSSMSLLGNNNGNANININVNVDVNANGESDTGVAAIAPRSSSALGSSVMAAPVHPGSGSSGHPALIRGSRNGSGSGTGIRAATPKKSPKPSGGPSRKKNGFTNNSTSKTLPHKAASSSKTKHSSSSSSSLSLSLSLSSSTSGIDEIVRRLICDQQELLRGMIQKETERFTSAAVMGPPPQQPLPLSFRAEATAVSTLTASLPKLGGTTTTKTKTESMAMAMAMASPTTGTESHAPPVPNATGALAVAAAAATATRAASESTTPAPAGAPATVSAM